MVPLNLLSWFEAQTTTPVLTCQQQEHLNFSEGSHVFPMMLAIVPTRSRSSRSRTQRLLHKLLHLLLPQLAVLVNLTEVHVFYSGLFNKTADSRTWDSPIKPHGLVKEPNFFLLFLPLSPESLGDCLHSLNWKELEGSCICI